MKSKSRADLAHALLGLQVELLDHQGEEIEALRNALAALAKSNAVLTRMWELAAEGAGFTPRDKKSEGEPT
jgi:uncharacterized lipoprotein NlpE involved in copper resistance